MSTRASWWVARAARPAISFRLDRRVPPVLGLTMLALLTTVEAFTIESLPEHDADVVLVINFAGEDQDAAFDAVMASPLLATLAAARADQVFVLDGTQIVGAGWTKMDAFLTELERLLLAPELDITVVNE